VRDPLSPVHPLKLPETCAHCHADAAHMAKYKLPTNQFAEYRTSVHWEALEKRGDLSAPSCASCHGNHGAAPPQVSSVANVCGSCHALMEDLFQKSPHGPVLSAMPGGACMVCHSNHGIKRPSDAMLAGPNAVCTTCHDKGSAGAEAAGQMAGLIKKLDGALARSDEILKQASRSGMEVSEAVLKQQEGRENLVKARVAVHAFDLPALRKPAGAGLAIAAETHAAGQAALKERNFRRFGLAVSLAAIALTILGLRLMLRQIERKQGEAGFEPAGESGR
jgi:predicted CXXCH cytochrome family protein